MRIAVASKSGKEVDQHFGHAERFLVYDYSRDGSTLVREVPVDKYCSFDAENPMRHNRLDTITEGLHDCRAVVSAMIGDYPKQELKKAGIEALSVAGPIEKVLAAVHDRLCGGGCQTCNK
ncbi:dinitrogenase iron-molybdenum cofactor biosynthesis protein [Desulfuromonas versatilis]|uniref:Dinitrogenase iron-molybdenum cofactor biosynthesis protein n=1 Tax=Desulfuromonas versatilis TaxID=2802975 RepID=A0ABN6E2H8_9BACT|nr:NifB/NifX family molybdenum-iron cluster-binding protein [Desulfuromonas versatilis]BCR06545.1 dinitrogenase iron-molybdenum cofactor biosynthesis protein [Desulfuromonas versatilis]